MQELVVAFCGYSGSGKTTIITGLVRTLVERGERVAVIKHSHHRATTVRGGDTERFLDAGAEIAILADDQHSVRFDRHRDAGPFPYEVPSEIVRALDTPVILIEGFKHERSWPRIWVGENDAALTGPAIGLVSDQPNVAAKLPHFRREDIEGLARLLDTIRTR